MRLDTIHDPALDALLPEQRRVMAELGGAMPPPPPPAALLPGTDVQIGGAVPCGVRIIRPPGELRGVLLHIHGGGFQFGTAQMADAMNSTLARQTGVATVSVEYRLAPAHPHPAALDDCLAVARWLMGEGRAQFGTDRLLVAGDSAGATLAVMTLLALRDRHDAARCFRGALLLAGVYDFGQTPSQRAATDAHFLSPERLRAMPAVAFPGVGGEALRDPARSPLYARLEGLPPALFSVGTGDSVLDDSLFMAQRWRAAGNAAQLEVYPEAPHIFMALPTAMAAEARRRVVRFVSECLSH